MRAFLPISLLCCLALGACTITSSGVRADPGEKDTIHVAAPFDVAYHNFLNRAKYCFPYTPPYGPPNTPSVTTTETTPGKAAVVELMDNTILHRILLSVDIVATDDRTDVTYYKNPSWRPFRDLHPVMAEWTTGKGTNCGYLLE